jgi:PAS domain S-box-containing protein
MRVGELARRTGVGVSTLRAWEARYGFLTPQRTPSGHRLYDEVDVDRVAAVVRLAAEGMTLSAAISRVATGGAGALPDGEAEALLFGQVLEVAAQAVWVVKDWRTRYANPAMTDLFGYTPEEFVKLGVQDVFEPESLATVRDERPLLLSGQRRQITAGLLRADGTRLLAELHATPFTTAEGRYDGAVVLVTDITERTELETQARLRGILLDSIGDAVAAADTQGTIAYVNAAAERMLGWRASDVVGRESFAALPRPDEPAERARLRDRLLEGRPYAGTLTIRRRDGRPFPAHLTATPARDEHGAVVGYVGVITDLTEPVGLGRGQPEHLRRSETVALLGARALHLSADDPALRGLVTEVVDATRRLLGAQHATALYLDAPANVLRAMASSPDVDEAIEVPCGSRSVPGYVTLAHRAVVVDDTQHDPRFETSPTRTGAATASAVGAPIHGPTGIVGVLIGESTTRARFTTADASFVQSMANVVGIVLRP